MCCCVLAISWFESHRIWAAGLVVGELCETPSHWRQAKTLSQWMTDHGVPGICGIDTRELTKKIRSKGTILGRIVMGVPESTLAEFQDPNKRNLVAEVSIKVQAGGCPRLALPCLLLYFPPDPSGLC
jgi:carbamoyl-phosphate synthase/aspartate carbamoyltransferase/dihydroorotase